MAKIDREERPVSPQVEEIHLADMMAIRAAIAALRQKAVDRIDIPYLSLSMA